jgi:phytoene synthase
MRLHSPELAAARAADIASCRRMLRGGSRTFHAASMFLPRAVREPASALYAFCRVADDAVDLGGGTQDTLAMLRERLERVYAGRPTAIAADRALADVVARFAIPRALPEALLEGFEWDAQGRRYDDLADLHAYAARVAGSVGAMMAMLMQVRAPEVVARACELGVAMQLSNIARDVGEDARAGRLYLPQSWLREAGIEPDAWLAQPVFSTALGGVVDRLLRCADALYATVDAGTGRLPLACRPGIHAARLLYADIGHEVARRGHDSVAQRAVVSARRKAHLLARTIVTLPTSQAGKVPAAPTLAATSFLVDAVATARPADALTRRVKRSIGEQAAWVFDLFERLERRDHAGRYGRWT